MKLITFWTILTFFVTLSGSTLLLLRPKWSKLKVWRILAFASGTLLGVSFIHILPEANHLAPQLSGLGVLTALLLIFAIEEFTMMHSCLEYAEECPIHMVGWTAFGALALHSLLDGIAIAISFQKDANFGQTVATAILIHKFTDGLTLTGLLLTSGYSAKKCFQIVALLGIATPAGVLLFLPFNHAFPNSIMGWLLGFVAGTFFYVGSADILPRLHKIKDLYCLFTFALGLLLSWFYQGSCRLF